VDAEGGHGVAWVQGIRLVGEPLLLLVAGLTLPNPRRTLRWAAWTLVAAGCAVAAYGVLQQAMGAPRLVSLGYQYNAQVRFVSGHLRSFGTFDDPFAYAAFLLIALAALLFGLRRSAWSSLAAAIILAGLAASLVRTGAVAGLALVGLVAVRRGFATSGALLTAATVLVALVLLVTQASGSESRSIPVAITATGAQTFSTNPGTANVILNGRVSAWKAAVGDQPLQWIFGRGVGTVGTAAARAGYTFVPATVSGSAKTTTAVDSGYLATVADVGIVGLIVLLMLLGRLWLLGARAARAGSAAGWVALGVLASLLLDALTRASFTGFPTAFLALLFIGIALAAAAEEPDAPLSRRARGTARRVRVPMRRARIA
jgi:O-antigen ligase